MSLNIRLDCSYNAETYKVENVDRSLVDGRNVGGSPVSGVIRVESSVLTCPLCRCVRCVDVSVVFAAAGTPCTRCVGSRRASTRSSGTAPCRPRSGHARWPPGWPARRRPPTCTSGTTFSYVYSLSPSVPTRMLTSLIHGLLII